MPKTKRKRLSTVQLAERRRKVLRLSAEGVAVTEIAERLGVHHSQVSRDLSRALEAAAKENEITVDRYRILQTKRYERLFRLAIKKAGSSSAWHERACATLAALNRINGLTTQSAMERAAVTVNVGRADQVGVQSVLPPGATVAGTYPWQLEPDFRKANAVHEEHVLVNGDTGPEDGATDAPALPPPAETVAKDDAPVTESTEIAPAARTAPVEAISGEAEAEGPQRWLPPGFRVVDVPAERLPEKSNNQDS